MCNLVKDDTRNRLTGGELRGRYALPLTCRARWIYTTTTSLIAYKLSFSGAVR